MAHLVWATQLKPRAILHEYRGVTWVARSRGP